MLDAIDRIRRGGLQTEESVAGWTIRLLGQGDGTPAAGLRMELSLLSPEGQHMTTVMDVKRK